MSPSVKISTASIAIEVEAGEMDVKTLSSHAIETLKEAQRAEDDANRRRASGVGQYL